MLHPGHCFRRTGATLLANAGHTTLDLQIAGGWGSSSIAEQYVDKESEPKTRKIAESLGSKLSIAVPIKIDSSCSNASPASDHDNLN